LLLHGLYPGAGLAEWDAVAPSLARHYRVYALDLLGYGYSDKPAISYSAYLHVTLINDFIREIILPETKAAGVLLGATGHSAATALMGYYFEPELFKKMLLIAPTGVGTTRRMPTHGDIWRRWLLTAPVVGTSLYNLICSRPGLRAFSRAPESYYAAHHGGASARHALAALLSNFMNVNIDHVLPLEIPLHLLWGARDKENPPANGSLLQAGNPGAGLTLFKTAAAFPHVENPRGFYDLCRKFF
jgi:pimeloyl-ACP methyl ester carboxylesterase